MFTQQQIYSFIEDNIDKLSIEDLIHRITKDVSIDEFYFTWILFLKDHQNSHFEKIDFELKEKRKDFQFKEMVKKRYSYQCSITHVHMDECEVAHIKPFSLSNVHEKYNSFNGILLSANLHKCFDKFYFSINQNKEIIVHPHILSMNSSSFSIIKYHKYIIKHIPDQSLPFLLYHYQTFLETTFS